MSVESLTNIFCSCLHQSLSVKSNLSHLAQHLEKPPLTLLLTPNDTFPH